MPKKYAKKKSKVDQLAKAVGKLKATVETYYFDNSAQGQAINYSGIVTPLTQVAQGDDNNNRSGDVILAKSLSLDYDIVGNGGNSNITNPNLARIMIVQDSSNTGVAPTASDILQVTGSVLSVHSPINSDHMDRYRILYDRTHVLNNMGSYVVTSTNVAVPSRHSFKRRIKLNRKIHYSGPAGSDSYKGNLYMLYVSDVNTNDPLISWYTRLSYNE